MTDTPRTTARAESGSAVAVLALRAAEQDVLVVLGEADITTAPLMHDQLLQALPGPHRSVLVELGALTFCDLRGLDALRDVAREAESAGVALSFRGPSAQLRWLQRTVPAFRCRHSRRPPAPSAPAPADPGLPAPTLAPLGAQALS